MVYKKTVLFLLYLLSKDFYICYFLTGKVGELTMALSDLLWDDMVAGPEVQRVPVPYL